MTHPGELKMSLDNLLERIEEDGRREAAELLENARREAARIKDEGEREARKAFEAAKKVFEDKARKERSRILSAARLESRIAILEAKDKIVDESFEGALKAIEEMKSGEYRAWLRRTILGAVSSGKEAVVPAPFDRGLLQSGLLEEINRTLRDEGRKGSLTLATESAPHPRGVILRDQKVELNLSPESLLRDARERHEEEALKILFGEEASEIS